MRGGRDELLETLTIVSTQTSKLAIIGIALHGKGIGVSD